MRRCLGTGVLALLAVTSVPALSACAVRPAGRHTVTTPTPAAASVFDGQTLPIQALMLTRTQDSLVHRAMQRLVAPCMKAQGFDVGLPDQLQPPAGGHQPDFLDRRYDPVYDETTARKYGYHLPSQVDLPQLPPEDPRMTPAARDALFGTDAEEHTDGEVDIAAGRTAGGGCTGLAEKRLGAEMSYVSPATYWSQPVRLLALDPTSADDPRVLAAQKKWSTCMAEKGYRVTNTVSDENRQPRFDLTSRLPSKAEVAAALWDVQCQQRTRVVQIAFQAESAYERTKIDEQAQVFAQIKKENETLVDRAATFLGEDAP